jgi:hypothetical protein
MIGLPTLRALDGAQGARIWLAAEATDTRCEVRTQQSVVRRFIREPPDSCETQVDGRGGQLAGFQVVAIP